MLGYFRNQRVLFGVLLVLLSIFVYSIHFLIFHDAHHIFLYLVGDIAFVFIEVLLVTLIIHQVISDREKRAIMQKLNMVIGAFFSEIGTDLLRAFVRFDVTRDNFANHLNIDAQWSPDHFDKIKDLLDKKDYKVNSRAGDLTALKHMLVAKREFLVRLLENPNLLEHEQFTELLWAVFHLTEELDSRKDVGEVTDKDGNHLSGDIKRAYRLLVRQWVIYMEHLKTAYPYLFSLAVRTNPFNPAATVEVK